MRNTILPREGFDPVALDEKDLRVSVRPGRAINSVKVELFGRTPDGRTWTGSTTFSRGTDAAAFEAAKSVASMVDGTKRGYAERADERIHSAVTHFVDTHPGVFWERWELQAFAKAKAIRAFEAAAWNEVLDGKALPEEAKRDVSQPWEGTFCIPSRSRWQVWTLPDDAERAEWDKAGILSLGLESIFSARGTAPAVVFLSSVREAGLADSLRAAHGTAVSAPDGRILFEYRGSGAVTLATPDGPVVPREDLMTALSELGRRSAWTFFENCQGTAEDIARDVRSGIESLDTELFPSVEAAVRSANRAVRKLANAVGLAPDFHEYRAYAPVPLPAEPADDMRSLAHALDAAGAHRFAEVVMDVAEDGLDGLEAVERELSHVTSGAGDILASPRHRLLDVPTPEGEAGALRFVQDSLEACRLAFGAGNRP